MQRNLLLILLCLSVVITACNDGDEPAVVDPPKPSPPILFATVTSFPHDTGLYTEGLVFHNGKLYESTGSPGNIPQSRSLIGVNNLNSGTFEPKLEIDREKYFGEGIAFLNGKIFQLTYKNNIGFIYDASSFKKTGEFKFSNKEGWGMTTDGQYLIMSDGTAFLTYLDPNTQQPVKTLQVVESNIPLAQLNELEFIKGYIYANVWTTDYIVKIDPSNGLVVGKINLAALANEARSKNPNIDATNGIAYDSSSGKIFVTGKLWPNIYQIDFPL